MYHILDLQLAAAQGTYVGNNTQLCYSADVVWSQHTNSYLSFDLSQVCCF